MANLQEKITWEPGIYQLETSDPVLAGPDGVDNVQAKQLANRTAYLKKQIDDLVSGALVAEFADRLKTPRNIAMTGDGNWNVMFDGSGNASAAMTLRDSGVAPGSYGMVTVDGKGRVTAGRQMTGDDVPAHDWNKISTGKPTTLAGYGIGDGASKIDLQNTVNGLVAGAPANLNTLQELAAAVNNDPKYSATVDGKLGGKADKASTLAGYGIVDAASKSDLNSAVGSVVSLMPPNLIANSHMTQIDENAIPAGFSVIGGGVMIKAVHPYTKGYEGPYTDTKPANATASAPANATPDSPFWFGVNYMGGRSERGGLSGGWGGMLNGGIMKITAPNQPRSPGFRSVFMGVKLPLSTNLVYFSAWFFVVRGSIGLGSDAGYMWDSKGMQFNPGVVVIDSKMTAAAPDGWYRYSGMVSISRVTALGGAQFSLGVGEGDVEVYMALPYLAVPFNQNYMVSC
ncbi:hypothetical protein LQR31_03065 [Chromobacterium vaccinii]|uniref:hypothetical protein n=1 Tax=Chromobacterium vaccinii TaxID=1108595 RepID=UPI001E48F21E|nr:hypothetical protein [Chromobacterium vaccinii]MCD4483452.1 hypothetical protein [Chromobacterium vaccinii]